MKRVISWLFVICLFVLLAACSGQMDAIPISDSIAQPMEYISANAEVDPIAITVEESQVEEPEYDIIEQDKLTEHIPQSLVLEPASPPLVPSQPPVPEPISPPPTPAQPPVPEPVSPPSTPIQSPTPEPVAPPSAAASPPVVTPPPSAPTLPPLASPSLEPPAQPDPPADEVSMMVWLSATGTRWHSINNCGNMNPSRARQVSLESARNMSDFGPCRNRNPPR